MENLLNCNGKKFSAKILDIPTNGIIVVENDLVYLCQNTIDGSDCKNRMGFKYSWCGQNGSPNSLKSCRISDFNLIDDIPQTFSVKGRVSLLKAFAEELIKMGYCNDYINNIDEKTNYLCSMFVVYYKNYPQSFKRITVTFDYPNVQTYFNLPEQFNEALDFCKLQINILNDIETPKSKEVILSNMDTATIHPDGNVEIYSRVIRISRVKDLKDWMSECPEIHGYGGIISQIKFGCKTITPHDVDLIINTYATMSNKS